MVSQRAVIGNVNREDSEAFIAEAVVVGGSQPVVAEARVAGYGDVEVG